MEGLLDIFLNDDVMPFFVEDEDKWGLLYEGDLGEDGLELLAGDVNLVFEAVVVGGFVGEDFVVEGVGVGDVEGFEDVGFVGGYDFVEFVYVDLSKHVYMF